MGQPVVHFEVIGKDGASLQRYYAELFDWKIDADNPLGYGSVAREDTTVSEGVGSIGGGIAPFPTPGEPGNGTFFLPGPAARARLAEAESPGGQRVVGARRACVH